MQTPAQSKAGTVDDLLKIYSNLVRGSGPVIAAKNIRKELKAAFPETKFSVKSETFSMGHAVRISWTDGPTVRQVEAVADKYEAGKFDGMDDYYTYTTTPFNELFGSAKYVTTSRDYSREFISRCIAKIVAKFGGDPITAEEYFNGGAHRWHNCHGVDLGRELNLETSTTEA